LNQPVPAQVFGSCDIQERLGSRLLVNATPATPVAQLNPEKFDNWTRCHLEPRRADAHQRPTRQPKKEFMRAYPGELVAG
jgi:hypothetical protein